MEEDHQVVSSNRHRSHGACRDNSADPGAISQDRELTKEVPGSEFDAVTAGEIHPHRTLLNDETPHSGLSDLSENLTGRSLKLGEKSCEMTQRFFVQPREDRHQSQ